MRRPLKRRKLVRKKLSPWRRGRRDGYRQGWADGYRIGQCQSILSHAPAGGDLHWDKKVLFVPAQASPYATLDQGIGDALQRLVREVVIAAPGQDVVKLASERRPDVVLVLDAIGTNFTAEQADQVRGLGILTAVWLPDDPYHSDTTVLFAPHFDFVFTIELSCVPLYQELGCPQVHYLPFAANSGFIRPAYVEPSYKSDICFIGSAYQNRVALFDEIAPYLATKKTKIIGYWWERLRHHALLSDKILGYWLTPEETAKYYNGAKIVINLHRAIDDPYHNSNSRRIPALSVNPRMFEIAACATLQLTDVREELPNLYTPGAEIESFSSAEELKHKIDYYLSHEADRRAIALRGFYRTVREHTYLNRLTRLLQIIFG